MDKFAQESATTHKGKFIIVEYNQKKCRIRCKPHNVEFETSPSKHLSQMGGGCKQCSQESRKQKRQKPVSVLLAEFAQKHGDKFTYPNIEEEYVNVDTEITIQCPEHGEYKMTPYEHRKSKHGCPKCAIASRAAGSMITHEAFLQQLKDKFENNFDYTKVVYTGIEKEIILICMQHKKEFSIQAGRVLSRCKFGCPDCVLANKKKLALPLEKFIAESNARYNNKFKDGFANTVYVNRRTAVTYECPLHGEVSMTPYYHLTQSETGCPNCSGLFKRTCDEFIADATKKHNGYYSYPRCEFVNLKSNIIITCSKHGDFTQNASCHLHAGHGCRVCAIESMSEKIMWTLEEVIEEIRKLHNDCELPDDYSQAIIERTNGITMLNSIRCIKHDCMYNQRIVSHVRGRRCTKCKYDTISTLYRLPYSELIIRCKEIHKDKPFEYQEEEPLDYKNGNSKIRVTCNELDSKGNQHGDWYPTAHNHINGSGCPKCGQGYSQKAIDCLDALSEHLGIGIQHKLSDTGEHRIEGTRYQADGYNEQHRALFEFHGCAYHGCMQCYPERNKLDMFGKKTMDELYTRTQKKKDHCIQQGYIYVEIWECDWDMYMNDPIQFEGFIERIKCTLNLTV
jgi:hypothetical protein